MQDFEEQERRLMAALGRLGAAMERLSEAPPAAELEAQDTLDSAAEVEIARLSTLLDAARAQKDEADSLAELQLAGQSETIATLEKRNADLVAQVGLQAEEVQRLRSINVQLRVALQGLREALGTGAIDADRINQAMQVELEEMRSARQSEAREIDALLGAIDPLIQTPSAASDAAPKKEADNA